jgi:hypothetical protein
LKIRNPIAIRLRSVLLCALMCGIWPFATTAASGASDTLAVRLDGDYLRVSLPNIDFLKGKPLDRLKDGVSVAYVGQITITTSPVSSPASITPLARSVARFALSYDIWEERFSVTKIGPSPESRRSASHLSAQATEAWCLDNLTIDRSLLPADREFYVQLDLRAEDPKDDLGIVGDPGINLTRLIELFGRPPRSPQQRWLFSSGPQRLADLKKTEIRGGRG